MSGLRNLIPRWRSRRASVERVEEWLEDASSLILMGEYEGVVRACRHILRHVEPGTRQHGEALGYLGMAYAMLQRFYDSYDVLTEALKIIPDDSFLWYNRGLSSRFTLRIGQSVRDFERALELGGKGDMRKRIADELKFSRKLAKDSMRLRGPKFTLDQLIEQEELFQQAVNLMGEEKWTEAEQTFRRVIEMGDCLPQPWGNLGMCLFMQKRFDEAETALKRALEVDPDYDLAHRNLQALEETRRTGKMPLFGGTREPFAGKDVKRSIIFVEEE